MSVKKNVVNSSVVISATSFDGALRPGTTATVDFVLDRAADVLNTTVAGAGLREGLRVIAAARAAAGRRVGAAGSRPLSSALTPHATTA